MVEKDAVSKDFRKQVLGYGLTTAEIVYRRPDRHWLLQTYVWQDYDMFPNFPALKDFLAFWETNSKAPCLQLPLRTPNSSSLPNYAPWMECFGCINERLGAVFAAKRLARRLQGVVLLIAGGSAQPPLRMILRWRLVPESPAR